MTTKEMICSTIRQYRLLKGYSQEYLAHHLGISQRAYSKLERGESRMTLDRLTKLCRLLEIDMQVLLGDGTRSSESENEVLQ